MFLNLLLALSFSCLILSLSFLCSSVSEALFALSYSFLSELVLFFGFFVHARATLTYSRIQVSQVGFNWPDEGRINEYKGSYNLHFVLNSQN